MTPAEYCQNKAAPVGSAVYYSLRRLSAVQRDAVIAVLAFYQEIEDITLGYTDLNMAHTKLNWWRDEVIRIQDGKPSHPVALRLQAIASLSPLRLIEIIDGLEQNLTLPHFEKFEDVVIHIMRTAGKRELLIANVLQVQIDPEVIYQFAMVIELTNYIQSLRRYVARGLIYFSQDELQQFAVSEAQLRDYKTTQNIAELLKFQVTKIKNAYAKIREAQSLESLIIRCEIACAVLDAIEKSGFTVLENFIDITPLRRWWIGWKT